MGTTATDRARQFATQFADRAFADAVELLADRAAVSGPFPDGFQPESATAEELLKQYWWGLHGQYGAFDGIGAVTQNEPATVTVQFTFENGTETARIGLGDGDISEFSFMPAYEPPEYADEGVFTERSVSIDAGELTLDGRLTLPDDTGTAPGVLLVHGAGIHDPDGTNGNSKILKDIAWVLATEGIASLRYEKRLAVESVPDKEFTLDSVVTDDAVTALSRLAAAGGVDEDALFVAGHSQGGACAPRIADRYGAVAGVVTFDGSTDPGAIAPEHADIIRYEFVIDGKLDEEQAAQIEQDRETLARIDAGAFEDDETIMGRPGVWHRSLQANNPVETVSALDIPLFSLQTNGADEQTQPELAAFFEDSYEAWQDADLPAGSRVERYQDVDHFFQSVTPPTGPLSLYFGGTVIESALTDLSEWIHEIASQTGS
ncbi:alpha/beta hydrolase family protein [Halovenus rubra]|uniref:Alpha/beta hydrolase family protein n=2 Tax=Halovenus rubra TaxID=869890 RepID=A0ABD5X121_9EURY|nr:alpha/beta hydrolase [Halovenus rubra]